MTPGFQEQCVTPVTKCVRNAYLIHQRRQDIIYNTDMDINFSKKSQLSISVRLLDN